MARDDGPLIISGPSGVGKTSVARALSGGSERFALAVTSTTRAARPGELDGRDYHFLSVEEFDRLVKNDGFIEHVSARGAQYGLTKAELERIWKDGRVHLVMPGDHYGRGDVLTYEQEDADRHGSGLPLVEFYDTSSDPVAFPGGQFVSRYYMDTLLGTDNLNLGLPIRDMQALSLDGGVPAWTVSGIDLSNVAAWLDGAHAHLSEQGDNKAAEHEVAHEVAKEQGVSLKGEAEAMRSASDALSGEHGTDAPQRDPHAIE